MEHTSEKEVRFTIKWELKDYVYFNFMHYLRTRSGKFYIISTIIFLAFMIYTSGGQNLLYSIVLILIIGLMNPLTIYIRSRKVFLNNKSMQNEQYYTVNDDGISIQIESVSNKVKWSEIYKINESKGYITVYVTSTNVFIIPKKVFSGSLEKIELLRGIIRTNLSAA